MKRLKFYIITVCYNQESFLREFIDNLNLINLKYEMVVVNNGKPLIHVKSNADVNIIDVENEGYLAGLKSGFSCLEKKVTLHPNDVIVLCNPDIELSAGFNEAFSLVQPSLLNAVWLLAPSISVPSSNKNLNPNMKRGLSDFHYYYLCAEMSTFFNFLVFRWCKKIIKVLIGEFLYKKKFTRSAEIFAPHGSCMITNANSIRVTQMLDFPIFLWGEEVCISYAIRSKDGTIIFVPQIKVIHKEHTSTSLMSSYQSYKIWKKSFSIYKNFLR